MQFLEGGGGGHLPQMPHPGSATAYEDGHVYVCCMGNGLPTHCPGMAKSLATPLLGFHHTHLILVVMCVFLLYRGRGCMSQSKKATLLSVSSIQTAQVCTCVVVDALSSVTIIYTLKIQWNTL